MILTKTEFKEWLLCGKCLWLKKKRPDEYVAGEFSLFLKKLIKDGYKVESYVQKLFPDGIFVSGNKEALLSKTKELITGDKPIFQATFETKQGLFAKVDMLNFNKETGKWDLYEIKASSEIKTDLKHNHIKDVVFQTIVVEDAGVKVGDSYIIYINKKYRRSGEVDLKELFVIENVTEAVEGQKDEVRAEIENALESLGKEDILLEGCDCLYRSHGQRCDSFFKFNPQVPEYSVHHIVTGNKLKLLLADGIVDIKNIPEGFDLTDIQSGKVNLQMTGRPQIDKGAIEKTLSKLVFPIYFLDYETYGSPIPLLDGYKTNQQIVFQVSVHKLDEDGTLEHFEYLADKLDGATKGLVDMLKTHIGPVGSVVVWYESFEKGRNAELAELHPESSDFLEDLNSRVFDLMKVFKKDYLHPEFLGSASIKKVLPVLLPELSYKSLDIQDGTMALSEWEKMIKEDMNEKDVKNIRENLLKYCALDTLAMVEIYKKLKEL
jgi:CRISPR/Cas system-associated exonuclease Cas4 (RecB family)